MGVIRYKQKSKNIVKLMQYLKKKYVDTNEHAKRRDKL